MMETFREGDFEGTRLRRDGLWAVAFLADWCPFCHRFRPEFERVSEGALAVVDLSDVESPLWDRFGVEVVPTVLVFRDGDVVLRADGRAGRGLASSDLDRVRAALRGGSLPAPRGNV